MARAKKKALKEGRILVFIDESGLRQRPHRCRTWAPRGQTPKTIAIRGFVYDVATGLLREIKDV